MLADAAIYVLQQGAADAGEPVGEDPSQMPLAIVRGEIEAALADSDIELALPADLAASSAPIALALLEEIGNHPELRAEVEEAYQQRRKMMVIDFGIVTGPALLYLVMKLKRIRVGKDRVDISFYEYKQEMAEGVRDAVGGG
jgi:hypothetical protein